MDLQHHVLRDICNEGPMMVATVGRIGSVREELLQKRHSADPRAIQFHGNLGLQPRAHLLHHQLPLRALLRHLARQEEAAQPLPHVFREHVVLHQRVQLVHAPVEGSLLGVHGGHDLADLPEDHGPGRAGDDDHRCTHDALNDVHRRDVAVAYRCNRVAREVQASQVDLPRRLLRGVADVVLHRREGVDPPRDSIRLVNDDQSQSPEGREPMRDHCEHGEELEERKGGVAHRHAQLEAVDDPRRPHNPSELQEADESYHLQYL
mmetsp:Transcript_33915/g.97618  ORF Transcript_33915/g.97618 Transcript_33915/m.97618 type:complete len:263 (+) Transcript_33915:485-1273(+)